MLLLESENPIPALVALGSTTWILALLVMKQEQHFGWRKGQEQFVTGEQAGQQESVLSSSHFKHLFVLFTYFVEIVEAEKTFLLYIRTMV